MGLEGAVKLALKKQLGAIKKPEDREQMFRMAVDYAYDRGKAINMASYLEIDGVIGPADTRTRILRGLKSVPPLGPPRRPFIDA